LRYVTSERRLRGAKDFKMACPDFSDSLLGMAHLFAGKSALVTGASSGLGEEFARQLAELGVEHLILVARRRDRLETLRDELCTKVPRVDVHTIDLSDAKALTQLIGELDRAPFPPDILINNAGLGDLGNFENCAPEKIEAMLAVNIVALTRLTRWVVPGMVARQRGWICNVGSSAGILPLPSFAVYAATKAYVNSFSEALRIELRVAGIKVIALCPGPVETEFGQVASRPDGKRKFSAPAALAVTKEDVVRQTLDALARGSGRLIPGLTVRIPMLLAESTPRFLMRFFFTLVSGQFRPEKK
jgi:short-subunit dehydrogenase